MAADAESRRPKAKWAVRDRLVELYRNHGSSARRLAYLMTGDNALAEDLVHDAFVRLFRRYGDLRADADIAAYLRRTVVNLAIDHRKRRTREGDYLRRQKVEVQGSVTAAVEQQDELWRALQLVGPRIRATLVLRYYEDLSERQTADVLGCSVGTVKGYASRGLKQLRSQMEGNDG